MSAMNFLSYKDTENFYKFHVLQGEKMFLDFHLKSKKYEEKINAGNF